MSKYILGGGVAGLIAGFYNRDYKIIDKNPLGQLNLPFIPGPRILKVDKYSEALLEDLQISHQKKTIQIGYSPDGIEIVDSADQSFKEKYSLITRGTTTIEDSFLSSGENQIEICYHPDHDLYMQLFKELQFGLDAQIIKANIAKIDTKQQQIILDDQTILPYTDVISTLNINIFFKLAGLKPLDLKANPKHFVQCEYNNPIDIEAAKKYHYVYSTDGAYTRKTYFKDYLVYEMVNPLDDFFLSVNDNKIIKKINNIPIQIDNSINFNRIQNIEMVGRFAQWNHSIKANEIIKKYEQGL